MDALLPESVPFPMVLAGEGERLKIAALESNRSLFQKCIGLGLAVGAEITVMRCQWGEPIVVAQGNARIAIDRRLAHRIQVTRATVAR
jgi:Fe2+ transport system protein FeoA